MLFRSSIHPSQLLLAQYRGDASTLVHGHLCICATYAFQSLRRARALLTVARSEAKSPSYTVPSASPAAGSD
eukprot:scaffold2224_cov261-Pinguiococcus_pyrenoidosus.AAC.44